jgi:hypothetical protein
MKRLGLSVVLVVILTAFVVSFATCLVGELGGALGEAKAIAMAGNVQGPISFQTKDIAVGTRACIAYHCELNQLVTYMEFEGGKGLMLHAYLSEDRFMFREYRAGQMISEKVLTREQTEDCVREFLNMWNKVKVI